MRDRLLSGAPPTVREVQEAMGFSAVESARKQLDALVDEGRLAKTPGRSRGYRLTRRDRGRVSSPEANRIAVSLPNGPGALLVAAALP